jgi:hypothetical protein
MMDSNLPFDVERTMKWRRGLLFGGIHFALAVFLVASELVPRYSSEKTHAQYPSLGLQLAAYQEEEQTVEFVPMCENWRSLSWQEKILASSELPATIVSGWNSDCPARWTTAGLIGIDIRHHSRKQEIASSTAFSLLVALQWLAVGSLPLIQPRRWWLEPGAFNTTATLIVVGLIAIGKLIDALGSDGVLVVVGMPAFAILFLVALTWVAWLALFLWKAVNASWKLAFSTRTAPGN